MKEKTLFMLPIEKEVEMINDVIIHDTQALAKMLKKRNSEVNFLKKNGFPNEFRQEEIIELTIFIFVLEILSLPNIFEKDLVKKIKDLSINDFSNRPGYNKEKLLENIKLYGNRFHEDIKLGVSPFDYSGILSILYEKLKVEKIYRLNGKKVFSPFLDSLFGSYITRFTGKWKNAKKFYSLD